MTCQTDIDWSTSAQSLTFRSLATGPMAVRPGSTTSSSPGGSCLIWTRGAGCPEGVWGGSRPPDGWLGRPPDGWLGRPPDGWLGRPPDGWLGRPPDGWLGRPPTGWLGGGSSEAGTVATRCGRARA